ncbi:MAG: dihydrofolate reductase family protein [Thermoplasmata archaeon]|nr:dihydrofolate reductase family protein [Thermoplasmata archaeon]
MGKLILFMVASLDGYVAGPNGELDWEVRDPEVGSVLVPELQGTVETIVIGRFLYEGFQQAWPAMASNPATPPPLVEFATWLETTTKVVFSRGHPPVTWANSRLATTVDDAGVRTAISDLKTSRPGDIVVFGGVRLAQTLTRLRLVDEYRLKLQPVALGIGQPLFTDGAPRVNLKLVKSRAFSSGVLGLSYQPA